MTLLGSVARTKESACGVAEANGRLGAALGSLEAVSRESATLRDENSHLSSRGQDFLTRELGDLKAANARLRGGVSQELESVTKNAELAQNSRLKSDLAKMESRPNQSGRCHVRRGSGWSRAWRRLSPELIPSRRGARGGPDRRQRAAQGVSAQLPGVSVHNRFQSSQSQLAVSHSFTIAHRVLQSELQ